MKQLLLVFAAAILPFAVMACSEKNEIQKIDLEKKAPVETTNNPKGKTLKIAIGGMITPKEGFVYYRDFVYYVEKKLGQPIELTDKESYAEINKLLESGELDIAFACSGPYVDGHDKFGLELLVAPEVNGKTSYNSLIIVNIKSPHKNFKALRGKSFAFTDPLSNTGKLVPTYMLAKMNETPESFFKEVVYTQKHDKSIKMVASNLVDGAAIDSLIWEYMSIKNPEITARTKVIAKSPDYGIPPVVVTKTINPEIRKLLSEIFLTAHLDPQGKKILKGMMIDRFVRVPDSNYDSVRDMVAWTKKYQGK